ncbi:MAG: hypothetical protein HPY69_16145 [Armatimonadetes bacterium]|nr:hypothetical protein [Armatimonadota bacterium]
MCTTELLASLDRYREAAHRGTQWLLSRQNADGSFIRDDLQADVYHKGAYALAVTGHTLEAHRLLNWIRREALGADGRPRHFDQGLALYKTSWIYQGAHRLGRFDISYPVVRYILRCQAPGGGFFQVVEGNEYVESLCTGWAGVACLYGGELAAARRCAEHLIAQVRQQPTTGRFYFRTTPEGQLLVAEDDPLTAFIDGSRPGQGYYFPGMACLFLCRYHQATRDEAALTAAKWLMDASLTWAEDSYASMPSGKSALGAAVYYSITGDAAARDAAVRFADYVVARQRPEGAWDNPASDSGIVLLDHTAEMIVWLSEIAATLGAMS